MSLTRIPVSLWKDVATFREHGWIYRGHPSSTYTLQTSLERSCDFHGIASVARRDTEEALFREFRRTYHQYAGHLPDQDSVVEWLALMQHHGAPTRLLDFSYSLYIASYFAAEADKTTDNWAIVAVRARWALDQAAALLLGAGKPKADVDRMKKQFVEGDEEVVSRLFFEKPSVRAAWPINAFRLNDRLRIQQGVFMIPGDVAAPFKDNLDALSGHDQQANAFELVLPPGERVPALKELFHMGISRTSLFPGLDGFAGSLKVFHPVVHDPVWK